MHEVKYSSQVLKSQIDMCNRYIAV